MERRGIPEKEYAAFIQSHKIGDTAQLIVIEGSYAWKITEPDGSEWIADVIEEPRTLFQRLQIRWWKLQGFFWKLTQ